MGQNGFCIMLELVVRFSLTTFQKLSKSRKRQHLANNPVIPMKRKEK